MDSRSFSSFLVGVVVGMLAATAGFAWYLRSCNLAGAGSAKKTVLKLAHGLDQLHPVHAAMELMAQRLAEKSGGTVELQIFPNGQLGSETECIEQLQRGALALTKTSAAPMESFVPDMAVFGVPYVFRDREHFWRVLDGAIGKELLLAGQDKGLRGLCYYDAGSRSFYTIDKPILAPEDLKNLKIRVQKSKTAMDMIQVLGGAPTPIPWGELYTALQQRMVDGAENNPPSFFTNRHFEVCKHFSLDEHTLVPDILVASTQIWQRLSPQIQQWVQEAAEESSQYQRELWRQRTEEALAAARQEGVNIYEPDKSPFIRTVQPMHRSFAGTSVGRLIERIANTE